MELDWQQIDTVFFDMDGTLLDLYFDSYFWLTHLPKRYAQHHQISEQQAKTEIVPALKAKEGTLEWYCLEYWSEQFKLDLVSMKYEVSHLIRYRPSARDFLQRLQQKRKRLVLATNAHMDVVKLKFEHTDLEDFFDQIICSHEVGFAKECLGFWEKVEEQYPFDKERSLFIDDNLNVLRQAREFGIRHLCAIHQPDSQNPPKATEEFVAIKDFRDCL